MLPAMLSNEIVQALKPLRDVHRVILFGSHARGTSSRDSDVDILVILNKHGFAASYAERQSNRLRVSRELMQVRKKVPMDLLVYTVDEWRALTDAGTDFARNIQEEGVVLV